MSEPVEYAIPVQVIAEALHADHLARWGTGSSNISFHREMAERAVASLADRGLAIVPAEDLEEALGDATSFQVSRGSTPELDALMTRLYRIAEASTRPSAPQCGPQTPEGGIVGSPDDSRDSEARTDLRYPEGSAAPPAADDLRQRYADAIGRCMTLRVLGDADIADAVLSVRDDEMAALRADLETARALVADYENTISWETTCHGCARLLDRCVEADQRREQAEADLTRIRAALNDMHPWSEIDYWVPCKDHSILDEESTLSACPNCVTEPETGCPRCGDVCDIRAILDPIPETPAEASPAPKETDA